MEFVLPTLLTFFTNLLDSRYGLRAGQGQNKSKFWFAAVKQSFDVGGFYLHIDCLECIDVNDFGQFIWHLIRKSMSKCVK